jgi:acyl-CoA thioesterase-2
VPATVSDLLALLDLETLDPTLFRGQQPDTTMQRVFGGQVAAQALVAAARTAPAGVTAHSLHSYFLRPGDTAVPIIYDVDRVRDGRSFATRRVLGRQHGRPIYALTASFQVAEEGFDHQDAMPEVPTPEESLDLGTALRGQGRAAEEWVREWAALEVRHAGDSRPGGALEDPAHPALVRFWLRVRDRMPDDVLLHQAALTYASDLTLLGSALVPHGVLIGDPRVQAASLDHTVWLHRPFRADEWLLYDQVSPSASGGRGLALGRLFTQDRRLVATVAQEGLLRPRAG